MREAPLSNCERDFLLRAIKERKRVDGRQAYDYRGFKIHFGADFGCCTVELGKTRVLAQVSCELVLPKDSRPTEGIINLNLELSVMAAPSFQASRQSDVLVLLTRLLERSLRNSRCIDTESLCVVSGEKVWQIRVDLHALNHDGNLLDAASVAAICALCHFRRPDVAVQGRDVTVFSPEERDPVPLTLYHKPVCISFAFFLQGSYLLVDPSEREEQVMDGLLVLAMNKHGEICCIQSSGGIMLLKEQVLRCVKIASVKVCEVTELIQAALEDDRTARKEGRGFGAAESCLERITALRSAALEVSGVEEVATPEHPPLSVTGSANSPVLVAVETAQVGGSFVNSWGLEEDDDDDEDEEAATARDGKTSGEVMVISDSEEEDVIVLTDKTEKSTHTHKNTRTSS